MVPPPPPPYYEAVQASCSRLPPAYGEDGPDYLEVPVWRELTEEEKRCNRIFGIALLSVLVLFITGFIVLITCTAISHSQYDKLIKKSGNMFFFMGKENITVNGTYSTDQSGITNHEVTLPSYNVSWRNPVAVRRMYIEIYLGEEEPLRKTEADLHDCRRGETWCFTIAITYEIKNPIVIEYFIQYAHTNCDACAIEGLFFNRTFNVDQWNRKEM